jgi:hypothetical protein
MDANMCSPEANFSPWEPPPASTIPSHAPSEPGETPIQSESFPFASPYSVISHGLVGGAAEEALSYGVEKGADILWKAATAGPTYPISQPVDAGVPGGIPE